MSGFCTMYKMAIKTLLLQEYLDILSKSCSYFLTETYVIVTQIFKRAPKTNVMV